MGERKELLFLCLCLWGHGWTIGPKGRSWRESVRGMGFQEERGVFVKILLLRLITHLWKQGFLSLFLSLFVFPFSFSVSLSLCLFHREHMKDFCYTLNPAIHIGTIRDGQHKHWNHAKISNQTHIPPKLLLAGEQPVKGTTSYCFCSIRSSGVNYAVKPFFFFTLWREPLKYCVC